MPARDAIVRFDDAPAPDGRSPWVDGAEPSAHVAVVPWDPAWAERFRDVEALVRGALGDRVLTLSHVGSTAVPGLAAKPVIDADLTLADPEDEDAYVPALLEVGFILVVREPWWYHHRCLRLVEPAANLHVFGPESAEAFRHRLFRDWLRAHPDDRDRYAAAKRAAAAAATAGGEHVMQYNARKQAVLREIYDRAFRATGLLDD